MQYPDETPFRLSGGATVWHLDKLYLIGGHTIEYDCELKSFYQQPAASVWIFDPAIGKWAMGAPLPKASLVTNDKTISFRGYSFGGCILDRDVLITFKKKFFSLFIIQKREICCFKKMSPPQAKPQATLVSFTTLAAPPWL